MKRFLSILLIISLSAIVVAEPVTGLITSITIDNSANHRIALTNDVTIFRAQNSTSADAINLEKSRGTISAPTIIGSSDQIGQILFSPYDGDQFTFGGAEIRAVMDGAVGDNDTPTKLSFRTCPDGSNVPVERMTINNTGTVAIPTNLIVGTNGTTITNVLSSTNTLDFPDTAVDTVSDLTITVTGAAIGDTVSVGVPNGSITATGSFFGWVSAIDTVTIRFTHIAGGNENPASGTFRATIIKF